MLRHHFCVSLVTLRICLHASASETGARRPNWRSGTKSASNSLGCLVWVQEGLPQPLNSNNPNLGISKSSSVRESALPCTVPPEDQEPATVPFLRRTVDGVRCLWHSLRMMSPNVKARQREAEAHLPLKTMLITCIASQYIPGTHASLDSRELNCRHSDFRLRYLDDAGMCLELGAGFVLNHSEEVLLTSCAS